MKKLFLGLSLTTLLAACGGTAPMIGTMPYKPLVKGTFDDPFVLKVGESHKDTISGEPRDEDHFGFTLQPGQFVQIETNTADHAGSTLKPYMVVSVKTEYGWKELNRSVRDPYTNTSKNAVFRTGNADSSPAEYRVRVTSTKIGYGKNLGYSGKDATDDVATNIYTFSVKELKE